MSDKCLKSDIYINEIQFCDTLEQAVDIDFNLPDYCPDIAKIYKCNAQPRICNKSVNGNTVTIEGYVLLTLLYGNKEGKFCSFEYSYPFTKTTELSADCTGANIFTRIKCEYINCRAVTGRKVDIHGAVGIYIKVFKRKCSEIVSDIDDCNIEVNRATTSATVPMGYAEKYLNIEEDLPISSGLCPIESILKVNSSVCVKETRIINDKAVVKGEFTLCILYCGEGTDTPQVLRTNLPYSQIIDIDGINDTCSCDCKAEISNLDIKPKPTSGGEMRCFALNAKLLLTAQCYCGNEIPMISDAFSRKFEAEIMRKSLSFDKITESIIEQYNCKKNIEMDFNITSIIDLWCSLQNCNTKFEQGNLVINGVITAGMIVCDDENKPIYIEKNIDFEYKYPYKPQGGVPSCEPEIEILSCNFTITSGNTVELRVELGLNIGIYEKNNVSLIADLVIDETKSKKPAKDCSMIIYYVEDGDTLWDIANRYSASVKEIMEINNLENNILEGNAILLIPIS